MDKKIELAKKIKALADRGIGGEKVNAQKLLEDLLKRHNINLDDVDNEKRETYFFTLLPGESHNLLFQIAGKVNKKIKTYGRVPEDKIKELSLKGNYFVECTLAEYIEIEAMYGLYKPLYKKELDVFFYAFCTANNLLIDPDEPKSIYDMTDEERDDWYRAQEISNNIMVQEFKKQLKSQNE